MPRARDLNIPFEGIPGPLNAITDVQGIQVGHTTLISGEGKLRVGKGPVRTGVSAILPRGKTHDPVYAGWYSLNGNGEMTGTTWVEESGFLEGPVMLTNTHSVGAVRDAVVAWTVGKRQTDPTFSSISWSLPVVAETYDGGLNDVNGFHVKQEHVFAALEQASTGPVAEGNVGGGTGMVCHSFKGGIGTASRRLETGCGAYTVGVLVQANYGDRRNLTVAGVPVGREIPDLQPVSGSQVDVSSPSQQSESGPIQYSELGGSSIIVVVATDAPLLPHQLKRLARRVPLGIARVGGMGANGSGDIFIAFSTANPGAAQSEGLARVESLPNGQMTPLFEATVFATEEAIINALVAAETMVGIDGTTVYALPHDRLRQVLAAYNRLVGG